MPKLVAVPLPDSALHGGGMEVIESTAYDAQHTLHAAVSAPATCPGMDAAADQRSTIQSQ